MVEEVVPQGVDGEAVVGEEPPLGQPPQKGDAALGGGRGVEPLEGRIELLLGDVPLVAPGFPYRPQKENALAGQAAGRESLGRRDVLVREEDGVVELPDDVGDFVSGARGRPRPLIRTEVPTVVVEGRLPTQGSDESPRGLKVRRSRVLCNTLKECDPKSHDLVVLSTTSCKCARIPRPKSSPSGLCPPSITRRAGQEHETSSRPGWRQQYGERGGRDPARGDGGSSNRGTGCLA